MPSFDVVVSCPIHDSFRVQQVAGMFDVPLTEKSTERFEVELPTDDDDADWQIGLVVGPSGSGKSTVARHAFADDLYQESTWPVDRAVVDSFGDLPVRNVVELLTAVGFGSPPSWVKPYHVLSCGERFRCDLARALGGGTRSEERDASESGSSLVPRSSFLAPRDSSFTTNSPASSIGRWPKSARPRSPRASAAATCPVGLSR